jgi:aspartokinase-like uncharacterized kinase
MTVRVRVIKLGGSLLDLPELAARFRHWLSLQPRAVNVVIVGGGPLVETLRELDARLQLPAETTHWVAVKAMDLMAELVAGLLDAGKPALAVDELQMFDAELQVLQVERFLRDDARSGIPLPCGWQVTSDSIAARVAAVLGARELVLLKSTAPAGPPTREQCAHSGFVDAYFARAAKTVGSVRSVNLRDPHFTDFILD